jgi:serine/threonine protein kinase, bacterial
MKPVKSYFFFLLVAIVSLFTCKKQNDSNDWNKDLKFQVDTVINITETTALIKGTITLSSSQQYISEYGVDYDTVATFVNQNETQINTNSTDVKSVPFSITINKLITNTKYYARIWTQINPNPIGTEGRYTSSIKSFNTLKFPLQITKVQPDSGAYHDQFTITGKGFSWKLSDNKVLINGMEATVVGVYADSLKVQVPKKWNTGTIVLKLGNETINGPQFRYIDESYVVYTIAGDTIEGFTNGIGKAARFHFPSGIVADKDGNIFVTEYFNNCVRKISSEGIVSTLTGSTQSGYLNGSGTSALFFDPSGILIDNVTGNILVSEYGNPDVRIISSDASIIKAFVGCDTAGYVNGWGTKARFVGLKGIVQNPSGDFFVTEFWGGHIRKIDGFAQVTTFAGDGTKGCKAGLGTSASIGWPENIISDNNGNLYISGNNGKTIFKIDPTGMVTLFAGSGSATPYSFKYIEGLVATAQDHLLVTDNNCIKQIDPSGLVTIFSGNSGESRIINGGISKARFKSLRRIIKDNAGNFYIIDAQCIRKIEKVE